MSPGPAGIGPVCPECTDTLSAGCRCEPALTLAHRESDLREWGEEHSTPSYPGWGGPICPGCCRPDQACLCRPAPAPAPAQELTLWLAYLPDGSRWGQPERDAADCLQSAWRELVDSGVEDLAGDFARVRLVRVRVEPVTAAALVAVLGREPGLDAVTETEELLLRLAGAAP